MENWELTSFKITKTVAEKKLGDQSLPNYQGELAVSFDSYPVDLNTYSIYFKAPEDFLRNQINSYGGNLNYQFTYSGYDMSSPSPQPPDVYIYGQGISLFYHSGKYPVTSYWVRECNCPPLLQLHSPTLYSWVLTYIPLGKEENYFMKNSSF